MSPAVLPGDLRVATLQWDVSSKDPGHNLAAVERLTEQAARAGAHLVVLPEMWSRSFCGPDLPSEAACLPERLAFLRALAVRHRLWIAGTLPEPGDGIKVFNALHLIDAEGVIRLHYRKVHLFPLTGEPDHFLPGTHVPEVCQAGPWLIGVGICYDLRFPELFRLQARRGANLFLVPAQFPKPRQEPFRLLGRARALDCQAAVVCVNRTGEDGRLAFFGGSLACDSFGNILWEMGPQEGVHVGDIRVDEIVAHRRDYPFLESMPLLPKT
ncbi:MAG: Aliphatic amidase AmiE [Candidatus Ozemobacter sibiricus]|uniref:Aliphatic amidase AmiE n=1 Tax=Candidatus Ozemobacter sibiricus TaxID=2268124 RepID=A0A367ZU09_9BACT|nr:MAG: Aliphatic amidase AmiE [Candidatus Ozemobacter sibiricus]